MSRFVPAQIPKNFPCNTITPKHPMNTDKPNRIKLHHKEPLPEPEEIIRFIRMMLGDIAPVISFGVAQQEALLKASFIGATPDLERSIEIATRHMAHVDPTDEAVATIIAGMMLVAALKSGVHAADAGVFATETVCTLFGIKSIYKDPDLDY